MNLSHQSVTASISFKECLRLSAQISINCQKLKFASFVKVLLES